MSIVSKEKLPELVSKFPAAQRSLKPVGPSVFAQLKTNSVEQTFGTIFQEFNSQERRPEY